MFDILRVMARNIVKGPATVRLPEHVPPPPKLRGYVRIDAASCVACGTCAYVCVGNAITGAEAESGYAWSYDPGRCTFCERCVDHCPGGALTMDPVPVPPYVERGELDEMVLVPFPACPRCGAPVRPAPEPWVKKHFAEMDQAGREALRLCVRCRRVRLQRGVFPTGEKA